MDRVWVIPLGGVGEIGKNCLVVETDADMVLIDAGWKFPEEEMLGIDLVIPDISYVSERRAKLRAILITHGHEDHIGALPFIVRDLKVPIYAPRLAAGLIEVKLREHHLAETVPLAILEPGRRVTFGSITVEPFRVVHSIPDCLGLALHTPGGTLVHTGDFKFDQTPVYGPPTDFAALADLGARGVLALLSDCTRVERPGYTPSERVVGETFDAIMREAPGRVIITTFASNIHRIQQAIDVAARYRRKVAVVGRSMESYVSIAHDLGFLVPPPDTLYRFEEIRHLPPDQVVLVTTGSQGEPTSVLSRIATNDHRWIKIQPNDIVIISASPIPGNEETVARTIDNLFRLGANVIYDALATVHVSGHASREELKLLITLLRPQYCLPIHCEYRHMVLYRHLAQECGLPPERVILPEIGDIIEFRQGEGRKIGRIPVSAVLVDGLPLADFDEVVLRDRQHLSRDGIVVVVVALERATGRLLTEPDIISRGFIVPAGGNGLLEQARSLVRETLRRVPWAEVEYGYAVQKIKEVIGEYLYRETRQRPMVLPVVTEV